MSSENPQDEIATALRQGILDTLAPFIDTNSRTLYAFLRRMVNRATTEQLLEVLDAAESFVLSTKVVAADARRLATNSGTDQNGPSALDRDDPLREVNPGSDASPHVLAPLLRELEQEAIGTGPTGGHEASVAGNGSSDRTLPTETVSEVRAR
jgi:hypothetical protein